MENAKVKYNNESLVSYFKELQIKKIELINSLENKENFNKMIDYILDESDNGMYNNLIIINGMNRVSKEVLEKKDILDIYNNFSVGGGVERRFFKPSNLNLDTKVSGQFKFDLKQVNYLNQYTSDKELILANKDSVIEEVRKINIPKDISDNTKLKILETILDKQRELIELTSENNKWILKDIALKTLKIASNRTSIAEKDVQSQIAELTPTLIKTMYIYDQNSTFNFNTLLFQKLENQGILSTNKKISDIDNYRKQVSLEEQEELLEESGKKGVLEKVLEEADNNKIKIGSDQILNLLYEQNPRLEYSKKIFSKLTDVDLVDSEKEIFNIDQKTNLLNMMETIEKLAGKNDAIEFLKAALKENNILTEKEINYLDVDDKWVETYKKYMEMKKEFEENSNKLFTVSVEGLEYKKEVAEQSIKENVLNLIKKDNIKTFNVDHREFIGELIFKEHNSNEKYIETLKNSKENAVGKEVNSTKEKQYKAMLDIQEYKTGKKIDIDSKLIDIDIETISIKGFEYEKKYSILEDLSPIYTMNKDQYDNLKNGIAEYSTKGNYKFNENNLYGKYGFDIKQLAQYGLINTSNLINIIENSKNKDLKEIYTNYLLDDNNWDKKYCKNLNDFLSKMNLQESLMDNILVNNYKSINDFAIADNKENLKFKSLDELRAWEVGGLLAAAHVGGVNKSLELAINGKGDETKMGRLIEKFYKVGRESSLVDVYQNLASLEFKNNTFVDPKGDYSIPDLIFNPLVQMEYFGKFTFEVGKLIAISVNNFRYEKQEQLKQELLLKNDSLLSDHLKVDKNIKENSNYYKNNNFEKEFNEEIEVSVDNKEEINSLKEEFKNRTSNLDMDYINETSKVILNEARTARNSINKEENENAYKIEQIKFIDAQFLTRDGFSKKELENWGKNSIEKNLDKDIVDGYIKSSLDRVNKLVDAGILKEINQGSFKFIDDKSKEILFENIGKSIDIITEKNIKSYEELKKETKSNDNSIILEVLDDYVDKNTNTNTHTR